MATARTLPRNPRPGRPPGVRRSGSPPGRVRWDRLGRMAMLLVLVILLYLYISPVRSLISAIHQSAGERSEVAALKRTTAQLLAERAALGKSSTLELDARGQGLVKAGEKEFVISGLPPN